MKPSGIGGMAVMEGVMMRNKEDYAVAVRKPNNEIAVEKSTHKDFSDKVKLFKLPVFRGMLAFVDSTVIGVKVLNYSASFFEEEEEATENKKKSAKKSKKKEAITLTDDDFEVEEVSITHMEADKQEVDKLEDKNLQQNSSNAILMVLAVLISVVVSVTLFMVLPVLLTGFLSKYIENSFLITLFESVVRLAIFIGYVVLASSMPEIKRVFMYHGAEHKTINCLENGFELTVDNVKWQSKLHKRCGTSFMLLVILISFIFFMLLPSENLLLRIISRVILVPFIAGVSYEFIRLAGKSESKVVHILSQPGLWMQRLTTKEPDDAMIEVAIKSVEAVFNWKAFLETSSSEVAATAEAAKEKKQESRIRSTASVKQTSADKLKAEKNAEVKHTAASDEDKKQAPIGAAVKASPSKVVSSDEEDDEILKALDKYFDFNSKESNKAGEVK